MKHRIYIVAACLFSSLAFANEQPSNTELFNQGIYQEEVQGDLEKALGTYQAIIESTSADRQTKAQAKLRLANINTLLGNRHEAKTQISDLEKNYADLENIAKSTKKVKTAHQKSSPELLPVPWQDNEALEYVVRDKFDKRAGYITHVNTLSNTLEEGEHWQNEVVSVDAAKQGYQYAKITTDTATNQSKEISYTSNSLPWVKFSLQEKRWEVTGENNEVLLSEKHIGTLYSEKNLLQLLRRLPLEKGYQASFPLVDIEEQKLYTIELECISEKAEVNVPSGNFLTNEVQAKIKLEGATLEERTYWVNQTDARQVVKVSANEKTSELLSYNQSPASVNASISNNELGFHLDMPDNWSIFDIADFTKESFHMLMVPKQQGIVVAHLAGKSMPKFIINNMPAKMYETLNTLWAKSYFDEFEVREDSIEKIELGEYTGIKYLADNKAWGSEWVDFIALLPTSKQVYHLSFKVEKEKFDEVHAELDDILKRITLNQREAIAAN